MQNIRQYLLSLSDAKYKKFISGLLPGINFIIGVRVPQMRKFAKTFTFEEALNYIQTYKTKYFEEVFIKGLLIAQVSKKQTWQETEIMIIKFLPQIDNWSVCDTLVSELKICKKYQKEVLIFIKKLLKSKEEFTLRLALVFLQRYFVSNDYIKTTLSLATKVKATKYYTQMGLAWLICECYIKFPKETEPYFNLLSQDVLKLSQRKIRESFRK